MRSASLFAVPLLFTGALAVQVQDPKPATGFVLEAGDHQITEIIDRAAKFLGRNYLLSSRELQGHDGVVSLQNRIELDAAGCEEVVSQLGYSVGLVGTPIDTRRGIWEWVGVNGPRRGEILQRALAMTPEEIVRRSSWKVCVTTQIPLKNLNANAVANTLRPFYLGGSNNQGLTIGQVGNGPAILVTGYADLAANVVRAVEQVDLTAPQERMTDEWRNNVEARLASIEKALREMKGTK
jgi:hypothetical protein